MINMFQILLAVKGAKELADTAAVVKELAQMDVLIGIPQSESSREDSGTITNAELAFIHTHGIRKQSMRQEMQVAMDQGRAYSQAYNMYIAAHGSPLWLSPPRPIIEPAIADKDNNKRIIKHMKDAATAAFDGDRESMKQALNRAGMAGQNAARDWFENPRNNWPPNSADTINAKGSDRPLVDTGELRKAITYVVRRKK